MSYVRRGEDSDLYIYENTDGEFTCSNCTINYRSPVADTPPHFVCGTTVEMVTHVEQHKVSGDRVPWFVIPRLMSGDG